MKKFQSRSKLPVSSEQNGRFSRKIALLKISRAKDPFLKIGLKASASNCRSSNSLLITDQPKRMFHKKNKMPRLIEIGPAPNVASNTTENNQSLIDFKIEVPHNEINFHESKESKEIVDIDEPELDVECCDDVEESNSAKNEINSVLSNQNIPETEEKRSKITVNSDDFCSVCETTNVSDEEEVIKKESLIVETKPIDATKAVSLEKLTIPSTKSTESSADAGMSQTDDKVKHEMHQASNEAMENESKIEPPLIETDLGHKTSDKTVSEPTKSSSADEYKEVLIKGKSMTAFIDELSDRIEAARSDLAILRSRATTQKNQLSKVKSTNPTFVKNYDYFEKKISFINELKSNLELVEERLNAVSNIAT